MGKRYTATEKWSDRWYSSLSPNTKLCLEYMQGTCDIAGIWEPNFEDAETRIGFTRKSIAIDWNEVFDELNTIPQAKFKVPGEEKPATKEKVIPHVLILKNLKWWLPRFISFQYGRQGEDILLRDTTPVHIPIFKSLKANGCWEKFLEYYPNSVSDNLASAPPCSMSRSNRKYPSADEVMAWEEGKGLPEAQLKLFWYTYKAQGWKINGEYINDPRALLAKWKLRYERDHGEDSWKNESPAQLKIRIEKCDEEIGKLSMQTHKPPGKLHEEIKPEVVPEIKRLRALKAMYEEAIRERGKK